MTALISKVTPKDPHSYSDPIITFDIDWAHDEVIADLIDLVDQAKISAVWFITHATNLIERLRKNSKYEIGIHPNFNRLLDGDTSNGKTQMEIVDRLLNLVPEATSIRSHSLTQSSRLSQLFLAKGITHESNDYIPASSGLVLHPWQLETGLIKVPYFWSDELSCGNYNSLTILELISRQGIKVFDFHPIHVFLNTENLDRYERTRHLHNKPKELIKYRYEGEGTRSRLIALLEIVEKPVIENK